MIKRNLRNVNSNIPASFIFSYLINTTFILLKTKLVLKSHFSQQANAKSK